MNTGINKIEKIWIDNAVFFIEGLVYIQGYNSPDYKSLHKHIRFKNLFNDDVVEFVLGTVPKKEMNNQLYEGNSYDYTAAGTATVGFRGIDISAFPIGVYEIQVSVSRDKDVRNYINLNTFDVNLDKRSADDWFEYRLYQKNGKTYLVKRDIVGRHVNDYGYINIAKDWVDGRVFHVEGEFIVPGVDLTDFTQGEYYLILKKPITQRQYAFELGQIKKPNFGGKINNAYGDYNTCYFATLKLEGIDTRGFELGEYELYVSLGYKSELFTGKLAKNLKIDRSGMCQLIDC